MLGRNLRRDRAEHPLGDVVPTGHLFLNRIGLIGRLTPYPGQRDALVDVLLELAELAVQAPGCHLYLVNETVLDSDDVVVVEAWRNRAMLDAWLRLPPVQSLMDRTAALTAEASEPTVTIPVGGKGLAVRRAVG